MATKLIDCFTDKAERNRLLHGQEGPDKDFIFDWQGNILPNILKIYLKSEHHSDDFSYCSFKNKETGKIELSYLWQQICIIREFIEIQPQSSKFDWRQEHSYKTYTDLLGLFSQCKSIIAQGDTLKAFDIAHFLFSMGTEVHLSKNLPTELNKDFIKFFQKSFLILTEHFSKDVVESALKQYHFIPSNNALDKTPKATGYTLQRRCLDMVELAFVNKEFKPEHSKELVNMLSNKTNIIYGIIFEGCKFPKLAVRELLPRLLFQNCYFENGFAVEESIRNSINFSNCRVKGFINFDKVRFSGNLYISFSFLSLSMEKVKFDKNATFKVTDTSFLNHTSFKGADLSCVTNISYTAFYDTFEFTDTILGEDCTLSHILFNSLETPQLRKSKQSLTKTLQKYHYDTILTNLGLTTTAKKSGLDNNAYEIALKTGFLKPEFAASYLEVKKITLQKKRTADRKKTTRDSIPFIENGRDIRYPVEALEAYKANDWNKLKELRKKYPIPIK